jgi:hypothetical protein
MFGYVLMQALEYLRKNVMTNSPPDTISIYSIDERPFGKTWEEWTTIWWRWFLSIPNGNNPVHDKSGEKSTVGQTDPNVWFLAGTIGGTAERTVALPAGKALLFPVINITISYSENPNMKTEEELISFAKSHISDIVKKEASIDGVELVISEANRVRSPPFDFSFPEDNIYGVPGGYTKGVGDGYWLFLKPLSQGKHNIRTFGSCMSGRVQIGVSVHLIVKESLQESNVAF